MPREIGARYLGENRCAFHLWAPFLDSVDLRIISPEERLTPMEKGDEGYWEVELNEVSPDSRYFYRLNSVKDRPDPAAHWQPNGVDGPSQIVDHSQFHWDDSDWPGILLNEMIMYELHVGTFTPEGTLDAIRGRLSDLQELGVNTLSLMPLAQFPGKRNWGYDTAFPFAVQSSYGGPEELKSLVNACHERGMAVIMDVIYNHLGPEGNYLGDFAPYFTDRYKTPWGMAVNFDQAYADGVRNYFIQNALHWFGNYHVDALRLDAVHAIIDMSAKPFLLNLGEQVDAFSAGRGRKFYLIAESDLNDVKVITPRNRGGMGLDAQWCDDFHHALHALLTGEKAGYYQDFGKMSHLIKAFREGYVISWQYSAYRRRHHGSSSRERPARQFVVFSQNHDQVGNRMKGERLSSLVSFEALKLAAGAVILSPYIPLIFMGEEYGEEAPFLYFVSHSDPELIEAVRKGRIAEFQDFGWENMPPDPQREETFLHSKLDWHKRKEGKHRVLREFYRHLIRLRKSIPALFHTDKESLRILEVPEDNVLIFLRSWDESKILGIMNFAHERQTVRLSLPGERWKKIVDSADRLWLGPGALASEYLVEAQTIDLGPSSFSLYQTEAHA